MSKEAAEVGKVVQQYAKYYTLEQLQDKASLPLTLNMNKLEQVRKEKRDRICHLADFFFSTWRRWSLWRSSACPRPPGTSCPPGSATTKSEKKASFENNLFFLFVFSFLLSAVHWWAESTISPQMSRLPLLSLSWNLILKEPSIRKSSDDGGLGTGPWRDEQRQNQSNQTNKKRREKNTTRARTRLRLLTA